MFLKVKEENDTKLNGYGRVVDLIGMGRRGKYKQIHIGNSQKTNTNVKNYNKN